MIRRPQDSTLFPITTLFRSWAFGTGGSGNAHRRPATASDDGLLTRVATLSRRESALAFRAVLSDAGIRSTVRFPSPHRDRKSTRLNSSHANIVCSLLLEKKKAANNILLVIEPFLFFTAQPRDHC